MIAEGATIASHRVTKALLGTLVLCIAATSAHAQSPEAEQLFQDGSKLMDAGKLAEACQAFEASNRVEARAGTLIRLGDCRERNHQLASAWSAYKDALTRVKDARKKAIATAKVAELEPKLSHLTVTVADRPDGLVVTRNGAAFEATLWNRALPVDGGSYTIAATAPGHREWTTTVQVAEASGAVTVEVPKLEESARDPVVQPPPVQPAPVQAPPPERSMWTGKRKLAVGVAGLGVASLATGITFAVLAKKKQDSADALCPGSTCDGEMDVSLASSKLRDAKQRALVANVSFGVAGGTAVLAAVLWLTGAPERASVAIVPGAGTLSIAGSW